MPEPYDAPPADGRVVCMDEFGPLNLQPRKGKAWRPLRSPRRLRAAGLAGVVHAAGRGPASISRTRPWAVRWSASAVRSAASRPRRFISYTMKMTRQRGAWALICRAKNKICEPNRRLAIIGPPPLILLGQRAVFGTDADSVELEIAGSRAAGRSAGQDPQHCLAFAAEPQALLYRGAQIEVAEQGGGQQVRRSGQ